MTSASDRSPQASPRGKPCKETDIMEKIALEGELFIKKKKIGADSWKGNWFILKEGSLFRYKDPMDPVPKDTVHLKSLELASDTDSKRPHAFALKSGKKTRLLLSASSADDRVLWFETLSEHMDMDPVAPPDKEWIKKKRGKINSMTNKVAGMAISTAAGKTLIKEYVHDDLFKVLDTFKVLVAKHSGEDRASELETHMFKIAQKTALLYKAHYIIDAQLLRLKMPLEHLALTIVDGFDMPGLFNPNFLISKITGVEAGIVNLLQPHLSANSMERISNYFGYFKDPVLLTIIFQADSETKDCVNILRRYVAVDKSDS